MQRMRRVAVVGTTGSGKTSLARSLAQRLAVPHVEMDALYWEPGWQPAPREVFRARVQAALSGPAWVTDGNYHLVRDMIWEQADTLVWLDYPLPMVLWRLAWRTLRRSITGEVLYNNNRERLLENLFGRDSIFLWALKTHPRHRREYPLELARPEHAHLTFVHLRGPRSTEQWLKSLD